MTLDENNLRLSKDEFYINKGKKKKTLAQITTKVIQRKGKPNDQ